MKSESAFFFSFGGDICTSANRKPRWGQSTRLAHICSFLSPQAQLPLPSSTLRRCAGMGPVTPPYAPLLPSISALCLCQAAHCAFCSRQGLLSENCFLFQAAPHTQRWPIPPPPPPPGLKNKQGGTRSPPDLRGHRLLLDICFPPPRFLFFLPAQQHSYFAICKPYAALQKSGVP